MMQIHDLAESFLGAMQHTFLATTRRAYRYDLDFFARSVPDMDAAAVTASHLRSFLAATTDRAPSTLGASPGRVTLLFRLGLSQQPGAR